MKKTFACYCILFFCLIFNNGQAQVIATIAGTGTAGSSGDGGPATAANIFRPTGIYEDGSGNIYFAEESNLSTSTNRGKIRKISPSGVISTICGGGSVLGDGGPASAASLSTPYAIVSDGAGNIYISDPGYSGYGQRVRKITPAGIISTFAGNGVLAGSGGDGGPATAATLNYPGGLAVDGAGNVYIAANDGLIRKVNTSGIISTYAGCLYCSATFAEGAAATSVGLGNPRSIALDAGGNLYVVDGGNYKIYKISAAGFITTIAGTGSAGATGDGGPANAAQIYPEGIYLDPAGNLYLANRSYSLVRKINTSGIISTVAGGGAFGHLGDGGPATAAHMSYPHSVMISSGGNLVITDHDESRIRLVTMPNYPPSFAGGSPQSLVVCQGSGPNPVNSLLAVTDANIGQTETWSAASAPAHGTLAAGYTATSTGGTVTPVGLSYTPAAGYSGPDAFTVQVSDGTISVTTLVNVTVNPLPPAGTISGPSSVCAGSTITLTGSVPGGSWNSGSMSSATVGTASGIVSGVSAGVAAISYSVTNGCGATVVTKSITINTVPAASTISGPSSVCVSSTITLTGGTAGGAWTSSLASVATVGSASGLVSGIAAGPVTITYTVSNGCGPSYSTYPVSVNPLPTPPAPVTGAGTVCESASITLADATPGGSWSSSTTGIASVGSATGLVSGVSAGVAIISYSITNSCGTAYVTIPVSVNPQPTPPVPISGSIMVCEGATITLGDATPGGSWSSSATARAIVGGTTGTVSGISAGVATISYTVTNSCGSAFAVKSVTIDPLPVAGTITGTASVCAGAATILSNAVPGGTWSSSAAGVAAVVSSGTVTGISAGGTLISYSVTNICGTAVVAIPLTVNALPVAGNITGADTVCVGTTTSLISSEPDGVWTSGSANAMVSAGLVTGISEGLVTITYAVTNICGTANAIKPIIVVLCPDRIYENDIPAVPVLAIYPNPNKGTFIGKILDLENKPVGITISDAAGKLLKSIAVSSNIEFEVTVDLAPGLYFLSATTQPGAIAKIIIY